MDDGGAGAAESGRVHYTRVNGLSEGDHLVLSKNRRMEGLCRGYVQIIAAMAGATCTFFLDDHGIDGCLRAVDNIGGGERDSGRQIDLQLKSTTGATITHD